MTHGVVRVCNVLTQQLHREVIQRNHILHTSEMYTIVTLYSERTQRIPVHYVGWLYKIYCTLRTQVHACEDEDHCDKLQEHEDEQHNLLSHHCCVQHTDRLTHCLLVNMYIIMTHYKVKVHTTY